MARKKQSLPFGVGCLAFFLLLACLATVTVAIAYLGAKEGWFLAEKLKSLSEFVALVRTPEFYFGICYAVAGLPIAIGLFARKLWAYNGYTILNGLNIGLGGAKIYLHHDYWAIFGITVNLLILIYMFLPAVRKVFT